MADINIKDVARLAGVGVSTVSRVINNHSDVNDKTKEKVLAVIKEYGYVPNNSARNLKRNQTHTVGVLIKGITNPFFSRMIKVIEHKLHEKGYSMILQQVDDETDELEAAVSLSMEKRLIGIIFLGGRFNHSAISIQSLKIPFVLATITLSGDADKHLFSSVTIDDFLESYKATDYLCKKGHKKISVVCANREDLSISALRLSGIRKACDDNGCPLDDALTVYTHDYSISSAYNGVSALLKVGNIPTCIFAISDTQAIGACKAVIDSGRRVPEDISVMGFDGIEMAEYYSPAITTVAQPSEDIAQESVNILLDVIEKKDKNKHKIFAANIVERQSVKSL